VEISYQRATDETTGAGYQNQIILLGRWRLINYVLGHG